MNLDIDLKEQFREYFKLKKNFIKEEQKVKFFNGLGVHMLILKSQDLISS
ncbi:hypothetical protein SDC9_119976 [bioreactor metagenome]|uniref:Uncharacterized protein n=1 Tax=bioreactor metagenome TaxID=1076179 RepID=A0A645C5G0_9ZZZZ